MNKPHLPCLAIAGPTASGKTAGALAVAAVLARRLPVEIISVDSALVYRGMDIGSAKPTLAERAAVAHHLIDIRDPLHAYSAAEFVRDATQLIADIRQRASGFARGGGAGNRQARQGVGRCHCRLLKSSPNHRLPCWPRCWDCCATGLWPAPLWALAACCARRFWRQGAQQPRAPTGRRPAHG